MLYGDWQNKKKKTKKLIDNEINHQLDENGKQKEGKLMSRMSVFCHSYQFAHG